MTTRARGTFEVKLSPLATYNQAEGSLLGRMSIDKQFRGDLEASSKGEMLTAGTIVKGSAGYVAIERVSGALQGRSGTFVLQHSADHDARRPATEHHRGAGLGHRRAGRPRGPDDDRDRRRETFLRLRVHDRRDTLRPGEGGAPMIAGLRAPTTGNSSGPCRGPTAPWPWPGGSCSCCAGSCPRCSPSPSGRWWARCSGARTSSGPLLFMGAVFVPLQVLPPIHQAVGALLGSRLAAWLYDRLTDGLRAAAGDGASRGPEAHRRPRRWRATSTWASPARRCSSRWTSSPRGWWRWSRAWPRRSCSPGMRGGRRSCSSAPGWPRTGCLRESGVWKDRNTEEVRRAQRHADYAYRLAVEPGAAKELRLFGLAGWVIDRFREQRLRLFELRWRATRLRERPVIWSLLLVARRQPRRVLVDGRRGRRRRAAARSRGDLRDGRHRRQHDRLRRVLVGARRRRRAGRGGAPPRGGDGPRRGAGPRQPAGRRPAGARDPVPGRHLRLPVRRAARCSRAST